MMLTMLKIFYDAFLVTILLRLVSPECQLVINEINIQSEHEFVELRKVNCNDKVPVLQSYLVIAVKEYEEQFDHPVVIFSADLYHQKFPLNSDYFVVGRDKHATWANLLFSDSAVAFRHRGGGIDNVLENGNKYPIAVILLKEDSRSSSGISMLKLATTMVAKKRHKETNSMPITVQLQCIIDTNMVDIIPYTRRSIFNHCTFFESLL